MKQFQLYRVCRRHFAADCFNGGCRRLVNTAIPTLHLNSSGSTKKKEILVTDSHLEQIDLQISNDEPPTIDLKVDDNCIDFEVDYLLDDEEIGALEDNVVEVNSYGYDDEEMTNNYYCVEENEIEECCDSSLNSGADKLESIIDNAEREEDDIIIDDFQFDKTAEDGERTFICCK